MEELEIQKIKVAIRLNKDNEIIDFLYFRNEDYTEYPEFQIIEVEDINAIIPFKTRYQNGQLVQLEDYCQEYYNMQNQEKQRMQLQQAIQELDNWFNEYDLQIKQYERDVRLGITGTYHIGDTSYTIAELDATAVQKATQINTLKQQLNNL